MGAFAPNGGAPSPPQTPDISVPDAASLIEQQVVGLLKSAGIYQIVAGLVTMVLKFLGVIISLLVDTMDALLAPLLEIVTDFQGGKHEAAVQLIANIVEDLLGVPVNEATIRAGFQHGTNSAMRAIGASVLNQLISEMSPASSPPTPQDGLHAAQSFLGFGLDFAIRQGNLDFIFQFLPEELRVAEGLRNYGELMARSLGLGRLARLAFAPIFKALLQDPLTWYFNQKYKPTLLGADKAAQLYVQGELLQDELSREMSYAGYSDRYAAVLQKAAYKRITESEAYLQLKFGDISEQEFYSVMQTLGYSQGDAQTVVNTQHWQEQEAIVNSMIQTAYTKSLRDAEQAKGFLAYVQTLPTGPTKAAWWNQRLLDDRATPRAFLTWPDMENAYLKGIVAINDCEQFLQDAGYSTNDQLTLLLLLTAKLDTDEARVATTKYKYDLAVAKAQAKGEAPPPPPAGLLLLS